MGIGLGKLASDLCWELWVGGSYREKLSLFLELNNTEADPGRVT